MKTGLRSCNEAWAWLTVEELIRQGVTLFALCPGSRSAPLAVALARHPRARVKIHFDERGAAFYALGAARATGRPAAWVTTSGTAVANGLPAVVEAAMDHVPLICLTADRPAELRNTGANQTILQPGIFGDYVRWEQDMPCPSAAIPPSCVLENVVEAVRAARQSPRGPVHVNCPYDEPLAPDEDGNDIAAYLDPVREWMESERPFSETGGRSPCASPENISQAAQALASVERGVVVAGGLEAAEDRDEAKRLAEALNWPLLADVTSGLRLGPGGGTRITFYDQVLAIERAASALQPEAVLRVGGRIVSKTLAAFLAGARPGVFVVACDHPPWEDPQGLTTHVVQGDISTSLAAIRESVSGTADPRWLDAWRGFDERAAAEIASCLEGSQLTEPGVVRAIAGGIPREHSLVLAASLPVRHVDMFASGEGQSSPVFANRGASGIDGTLATAAGVAEGSGRPVTLLVGDLALLHDLNSLALVAEAASPVTVVVLNNGGGGIFSLLPIARHEGVFEPYFGTPHNRTFEDAARMFDLAYARPATMPAFEAAYRDTLEDGVSSIIEVRTGRAANADLLRHVRDRLAALFDA